MIWSVPAGNNRIIAGVCAVLTVLLVIVALTAGLLCRKKDFVDKYIFKRSFITWISLVLRVLFCSTSVSGFYSSTLQLSDFLVHRKVHSASGKLNPMLEEPRIKERPQISQPTFMASTATRACAPLIVTVSPSRAAQHRVQTGSRLVLVQSHLIVRICVFVFSSHQRNCLQRLKRSG